MKTSGKGLIISSSPGRAENLPALPPLMRLLSRSRGRLSSSHSHPRSSPMFVVTRRKSGAEIQEEKEPTSPQVTCIGQVRITAGKKKKPSSSSSKPPSNHRKENSRPTRCHCNPFSSRKPKPRAGPPPQPQPPPPLWRRWQAASSSTSSRGYRLRMEEEEEQNPSAPARADREEEEEDGVRVFVPATPPKNALLLMRCRSAPHRAPSLAATRFGGAAAAAAAMESGRGEESEENGEEGREGGGEEAALGSEVGPSPSFSSQPLILTRCKSEPAKKAAKLAPPEASYCFWNHPTAAINIINNSKIKNKSWFPLVEEPCPPQNFQ